MKKYLGIFIFLAIAFNITLPRVANADTLICERYDMGLDTTTIFSYTQVSKNISEEDERPSDIIDIEPRTEGHSYVQFRDGGYLFFNSATVTCHSIHGNSDEVEAKRVIDFVNTIMGTRN